MSNKTPSLPGQNKANDKTDDAPAQAGYHQTLTADGRAFGATAVLSDRLDALRAAVTTRNQEMKRMQGSFDALVTQNIEDLAEIEDIERALAALQAAE